MATLAKALMAALIADPEASSQPATERRNYFVAVAFEGFWTQVAVAAALTQSRGVLTWLGIDARR